MREMPGLEEALLRITGAETDDHSVPVEILVRVLDAMQQTLYLLASAGSERALSQRFKPTDDERRLYQLRAELPVAGSYALPLEVGPRSQTDDRYEVLGPKEMLRLFYELLHAVEESSRHAFAELVPDMGYRSRVLQELQRFLPKAGERWGIGLAARHMPEVRLDTRAARVAKDWQDSLSTTDEATMTLTGELVSIDFDQRQLSIRYKPTGRRVVCVYLSEVEETLFANRRGKIQVTGTATLDGRGLPRSLSDVTRIEAVDLSPVAIERVERAGRRLDLRSPLVLLPSLDADSGQFYEVSDDAFGIRAFSQTREGLVEELEEQLLYLWDDIASEAPDALTEHAQKAAAALRELIREVNPHAARPG